MEYLKVWTSFREFIEPLKDAEKGRLFYAMLVYAESGEEPVLFEGNERFIWPVARQGIDATSKKVEALKANGSKGGRGNTKDKQEEATESNEKQNKANERLNVNVKDNVNIKEKVNKRFIPPSVEEVAAYCRERGNNVDAQTFVDFYSSKGWRVGNSPMKDWKACVRTWERGRSNTSERQPPRLLPAQAYSQRDYSGEDDEAIRRMLAMGEKEGIIP